MRVVIVDDERICVDIAISLLGKYCSDIEIVGTASSVAEGKALILKTEPDVVFTDVELQDGTAIEMLCDLSNIKLNVIFVTGHDKYAINAFQLSAVDFLLKPLDGEALAQAVTKCREKLEIDTLRHQIEVLKVAFNNSLNRDDKIVLSDSESIYFVHLRDILWCKADGVYTNFKLINGQNILVSKNLKKYENLLPTSIFFRAHNSYLVNLSHVLRFDRYDGGFVVMTDDSKIPVSSRKKEAILEKLSHNL